MFRFIFFTLLFSIPLFGSDAVYKLSYDKDMSPYAGGEDLLFGTRVIERGSIYLNEKIGASPSKNLLARTWRALELSLLYFPLNYFTSVVQHEIFGHGYRIRDINDGAVYVKGYQFNLPPPYGRGSASTQFSFDPRRIYLPEYTAIAIGGIEAENILAFQTSFKWIFQHRIDPRQVALYLTSRYSLNIYQKGSYPGNDLYDYIQTLNHTYTDGKLTLSRLKSLSYINLIDPMTVLSSYAWLKYIFSGKEMKLSLKYLPSLRVGLSPFGPEYYFDQYLFKDRPTYFYIKGGRHAKNLYFGYGSYLPHLYKKDRWSFGMRFDFWVQPKLLFEHGRFPLSKLELRANPTKYFPLYSFDNQHTLQSGLNASIIESYQKNKALGFELEIGGKTQGYLPGYPLKAAFIFRFSYLASF